MFFLSAYCLHNGLRLEIVWLLKTKTDNKAKCFLLKKLPKFKVLIYIANQLQVGNDIKNGCRKPLTLESN